ncbi:hypothetical protein [Peptoniphilus sp.]|uniref:hypothetical protein n=1 Tax=Peptoniphilus sp. TaxID=1971214 RepID=UPI0039910FB8
MLLLNFEYFYNYQKEKALAIYKAYLNEGRNRKLFFLEYDRDLIKEIYDDLESYKDGDMNLEEFKSKYSYLGYGGIDYFIQSYYNFEEEVEYNQEED